MGVIDPWYNWVDLVVVGDVLRQGLNMWERPKS